MQIKLFKTILISVVFIGILFITLNYFVDIQEPTSKVDEIIVAATYYGNSWVVNFWNSDFSSIEQDMLKIKNDGFNTIILVVPWGEFQTGISPIKYNEVAFKRLHQVIEEADQYNLDVILRIGYAHDLDPDDQLPFKQRFVALPIDKIVYDAYLDYIHKVYTNVKDYKNIKFAFITWEDFSSVFKKSEEEVRQELFERIKLPHQISFSEYLHEKYDLKEISKIYGYSINSEDDIPTPQRNSTAFPLFLEFNDNWLIEKIFKPAQEQYPNLSMEVRVDYDPIFYSNGTKGWFSHSSTYNLSGTEYTVVYYSPPMGAANNYDEISSTEALSLMNYKLKEISENTQDKKIFIDQFIWSDNTPGFESNTKILSDEIDTFLRNSCDVIKKHTIGYGVWTYKDYKTNIVYNPSFSLGTKGWIVDGNFHIKKNEIVLDEGSSLTQLISGQRLDLFKKRPMSDISFYAKAVTPDAKIKIEFGDNMFIQTINNTDSTYHKKITKEVRGDSSITFQVLDGSMSLSNVELYNFIQQGEIYDVDSNPDIFLEPMRQLNKCLLSESKKQNVEYEPHMISNFKFDGSSDSFDHVGKSNNISMVNGNENYVKGKLGKAFQFDGESYITISNNSDYNFERIIPFSISFWIKTNSISGVQSIISKGGHTGWTVDLWEGNNKFVLKLVNSTNTNELRVRGEIELDDGLWHNIVITYDGSSSASGVKMYNNNQPLEVGIEADSLSDSIVNDNRLTIGGYDDGSRLFNGTLDDVRIYHGVLDMSDGK